MKGNICIQKSYSKIKRAWAGWSSERMSDLSESDS